MKRQLLMVHGLCGSADIWTRIVAHLQGEYDCHPITILPELRSTKAPPLELADKTLQDYIDHVETIAIDLAKKNGGHRPIIIGHSLGGLIAQKIAETGRVAAAIFLTSAHPMDCRVTKLSVYRSLFSILKVPQKNWRGRSYKLHGRSFCWGNLHNIPRSRHKDILASLRYDSGRMIYELVNTPPNIDEKRIFVPSLTIGAGRDRTTPVQGSRKMAEKYRWAGSRGDYLEYPKATHWIIDEDGTDEVVNDIKTWLNRRIG